MSSLVAQYRLHFSGREEGHKTSGHGDLRMPPSDAVGQHLVGGQDHYVVALPMLMFPQPGLHLEVSIATPRDDDAVGTQNRQHHCRPSSRPAKEAAARCETSEEAVAGGGEGVDAEGTQHGGGGNESE